jgi:hypothetical protein
VTFFVDVACNHGVRAGGVAKVDEQALCYQIKFDKIETPRAIQFDFPLKRVMEELS